MMSNMHARAIRSLGPVGFLGTRSLMSTLLFQIRWVLLLIACLLVHSHGATQVRKPPFPELGVYEIGGVAVRNWSEIRPFSHHVVLVVSAYEPISEELLKALSAGSAGDGMHVFVVGALEQVEAFAKDKRSLLPKAAWNRVSREVVSIAFRQSGTPQMHGVDPSGTTAWLFPGLPQPREKAVSMVKDWVNRSRAELSSPAAR